MFRSTSGCVPVRGSIPPSGPHRWQSGRLSLGSFGPALGLLPPAVPVARPETPAPGRGFLAKPVYFVSEDEALGFFFKKTHEDLFSHLKKKTQSFVFRNKIDGFGQETPSRRRILNPGRRPKEAPMSRLFGSTHLWSFPGNTGGFCQNQIPYAFFAKLAPVSGFRSAPKNRGGCSKKIALFFGA